VEDEKAFNGALSGEGLLEKAFNHEDNLSRGKESSLKIKKFWRVRSLEGNGIHICEEGRNCTRRGKRYIFPGKEITCWRKEE